MKVSILCLIQLLFLSMGFVAAQDDASSTRWEYKIWVQPDDMSEFSFGDPVEKELNELGRQGWELVTVMWKNHSDKTYPTGRAIYYFKRLISPINVEEVKQTPTKRTAEQVGTGQPATRPESKSEGSDKPQPEAEERSR